MIKNKFKTTDGLMRHLRKNGIQIDGSKHKQQLINTGYYHGYKGYRFFQTANRKLPFSHYNEISATIEYDTKLKSLIYSKMMYIETSLKNVALNTIMNEINSNSIYDMYEKVVASYKNAPSTLPSDKRKKMQVQKLNLQGIIQNAISYSYKKDNAKISHFYNNPDYTEVPIWAVFEILTMGDFGFLLSCLTLDMREKISNAIGINLSSDTNRELVYKYVYALKDLRNAIAHNDIIYDTRFRKFDPTRPMKRCLMLEMNLPYFNFKTLGDYVILMCYFLKLFKVTKTELKVFLRDFEKITSEYKNAVDPSISSITIHSDLASRILQMKNSL